MIGRLLPRWWQLPHQLHLLLQLQIQTEWKIWSIQNTNKASCCHLRNTQGINTASTMQLKGTFTSWHCRYIFLNQYTNVIFFNIDWLKNKIPNQSHAAHCMMLSHTRHQYINWNIMVNFIGHGTPKVETSHNRYTSKTTKCVNTSAEICNWFEWYLSCGQH